MKSSSFITHDLTEPYSGTIEAAAVDNPNTASDLAGSSSSLSASYSLALRKVLT